MIDSNFKNRRILLLHTIFYFSLESQEEIEQEPGEETVHQVVRRSIAEQYHHEEEVEQYPTNKRYR